MNDIRSVSVARFVAAGLAAVLIFNILLLLAAIKLNTVDTMLNTIAATMGIAIGVAMAIATWFTKSLGRIPTKRECLIFLWCYGGIIALAFTVLVILVSLESQPSAEGLFILFLHYLPYPAFAQKFFSEKHMSKILLK
ncbi:MAG: hypothetical protein FWF20_04995 [Betaproteobacteria bacterium]|nr:hypothetical protein [Betaproteobacteria bacterium]MCL2886133.1 hypothetical protein [Betaproteobacteria bacterium]